MSGVNIDSQSTHLSLDASGNADASALSAPANSESPSLFGRYRSYVADGVRRDSTFCNKHISGENSSIPVKALGGIAKAVVVASGVVLRTTLLAPVISWAKDMYNEFVGWVLSGGVTAAINSTLGSEAFQSAARQCVNTITGRVGADVENRSRPYTIAASALFVAGAVGTKYFDLGSGPADALAGGLITVAGAGAINFVAQSLDVTSEKARPYVIGGATVFASALAGTAAAVASDYASSFADAIPYGAATAAVGAIGVLGAYYAPKAYAYFWGKDAEAPSSPPVLPPDLQMHQALS